MQFHKHAISRIAALGMCGLISACSGQDVRQSLGMERNQPDAFQVVKRPPLSVPPVYHLRPPSDEAVNAIKADERAQALVLRGEELPEKRDPSETDPAYMAETGVVPVESAPLESGNVGDSVLLNKAGANKAQGNIRAVLNQETRAYTAEKREEESSLIGKVNPFPRKEGDPTVDAKLEAERLTKNKAEGAPVNKGDVPEVDPKKEGIF